MTEGDDGALAPDRPEPGADGATIRKAHYGPGRQPFDDMVDEGLAADFLTASVLRYLRRDKAKAHSLESARRYVDWLNKLAVGSIVPSDPRSRRTVLEHNTKRAQYGLSVLNRLLTSEEKGRLS